MSYGTVPTVWIGSQRFAASLSDNGDGSSMIAGRLDETSGISCEGSKENTGLRKLSPVCVESRVVDRWHVTSFNGDYAIRSQQFLTR